MHPQYHDFQYQLNLARVPSNIHSLALDRPISLYEHSRFKHVFHFDHVELNASLYTPHKEVPHNPNVRMNIYWINTHICDEIVHMRRTTYVITTQNIYASLIGCHIGTHQGSTWLSHAR